MDANSNDLSSVDVVCTMVGDRNVGKTSILETLRCGKPTANSVRRLAKTVHLNLKVTERRVHLHLEDTSGSDSMDILRPALYASTDIFVLCFSTYQPDTLDRVLTKWLPELARHRPQVPIVLLGTQTDLRDTAPDVSDTLLPRFPNAGAVSRKAAKSVAKDIGAAAYFECTIWCPAELAGLPQLVAKTGLRPPAARRGTCCVS